MSICMITWMIPMDNNLDYHNHNPIGYLWYIGIIDIHGIMNIYIYIYCILG